METTHLFRYNPITGIMRAKSTTAMMCMGRIQWARSSMWLGVGRRWSPMVTNEKPIARSQYVFSPTQEEDKDEGWDEEDI